MKKGFTLIELLVVVLIIGILSAVALPQYTKAVEKARLSEALINAKAIEDTYKLYLLEQAGYPSSLVYLKDIGGATELSGGQWSDNSYITKNFEYHDMACSSTNCTAQIDRRPYQYSLEVNIAGKNACYTQNTDLGKYICKSLKSQGWEYIDGDY